jgi:hypothetical protein
VAKRFPEGYTMKTKTMIRSVLLVAVLAILGLSQVKMSSAKPLHLLAPKSAGTGIALASPTDPMPPFDPPTGGMTAQASPTDPMPPFDPPTGGMTAQASPTDPMPPFDPPTGGMIAQASPTDPMPPFDPPTGGSHVG